MSPASKSPPDPTLPRRVSNAHSPRPRTPRVPPVTSPFSPEPKRIRQGPRIAAGLAVYGATAFGTYLYFKPASAAAPLTDVPEDVSDRYNATATGFDAEVGRTETLMGIGWLRWWLTRKARGDVLEVAVGTGRNAGGYRVGREGVRTITWVEKSAEMMAVARGKWLATHPRYKSISFVVQSAHDPIPCPSTNGFDTVLQTMGLCSTTNPAGLLAHLGTMVNPEEGQILLLEHGRSHYAWLNKMLDDSASAHADKHGCWWNRDIGKIVEESGLEVVKMKRYHLGTTWWVELKPKRKDNQVARNGNGAKDENERLNG